MESDEPTGREVRLVPDETNADSQNSIQTDKEFFIRKAFEQDSVKGYELLFRQYYSPLCSHAVRFVYNREVAEDLVAEVFYTFWKKKLHEQITTSFRAYLFTSVRNKSLTYIKWEFDKEKSEELEENDKASSTLEPDEVMEFDELYLHIEKTINQLPPQCQKVFLMSRFEGKSYKEIAEKLNVSGKAVEAHISKALITLRKALQNYWLFILSAFLPNW
ncbi:RNA polymerase sigma-70 factor [Dyadobacter sp. UP-52]|uniref:RNA polymerase sigma-70 factor n=1 Tax=Dyadobacter subterraneus TaxID=2773304 RepID=A0ABR9W7W0_9BACT|nr:RNA polymerase sigma-70 factor [Dyadobacter subterraneus]